MQLQGLFLICCIIRCYSSNICQNKTKVDAGDPGVLTCPHRVGQTTNQIVWFISRHGEQRLEQLDPSTDSHLTSGVSVHSLIVENITSNYEGMYHCRRLPNTTIITSACIFVLGKAVFKLCEHKDHCNHTLNGTEGEHVTFDTSINYINGGPSHEHQKFKALKFFKLNESSNDFTEIYECNGTKQDCQDSERIEVFFTKNSTALDIKLTLRNLSQLDNGVFKALLQTNTERNEERDNGYIQFHLNVNNEVTTTSIPSTHEAYNTDEVTTTSIPSTHEAYNTDEVTTISIPIGTHEATTNTTTTTTETATMNIPERDNVIVSVLIILGVLILLTVSLTVVIHIVMKSRSNRSTTTSKEIESVPSLNVTRDTTIPSIYLYVEDDTSTEFKTERGIQRSESRTSLNDADKVELADNIGNSRPSLI